MLGYVFEGLNKSSQAWNSKTVFKAKTNLFSKIVEILHIVEVSFCPLEQFITKVLATMYNVTTWF